LQEKSLSEINFEIDNKFLNINGVGESKRLRCTGITENGIRIEKVYTFYADKYLFELHVSIQNHTERLLKGDLGVSWTHEWDSTEKSSRFLGNEKQ
jgi:YidC/Oxa1 family membrane protein insertase